MRIPGWHFKLGDKHPPLEVLSEHVDGRLTGRARERLEAHLQACAACRKDEDCRSGFGEGAACVICANGSCPVTDDRACVPPAA